VTIPGAEMTANAPFPMEPTGACWICGASALDRVWSDPFDLSDVPRFGPYAHADHPPSWVVRCRSCGFGQAEALPAAPDYFDTLYEREWPEGDMEANYEYPYRDFIYGEVLEGLARCMGPGVPRTLLDVGAHTGRFLHLARRAGWGAEGAELNPVTAEFAARKTGAPVHSCRAEDLAARGRRFGAVTLNDVLEHIPRPALLVAGLRGLLEPGGVLAIKVPHGPMQRLKEGFRRDVLRGDWRRDRIGVMVRYSHVNHFTVGSLRLCLEGAGFRPVVVAAGAPEFLPASSPGRTPRQAASAWARRAAYRAAGLIPGGARTPLAMNLQAFGVNPG
jgi:SAM-dependent methyltransferase